MTQTSPVRARWAVGAIFFLHGSIWGSWVPHLPLAKERLDVGPGLFGLLLLMIAAGAVTAMPIAGALINRYGSARVTAVTGVLFSLLFLGPVLSSTISMFVVTGFLFGAATGSMDVAMNAHGIAVEKALRRPTLSIFHGFFSLGGMMGAFLGALALKFGSEGLHVTLASLTCLAALLAAFRYMLPAGTDKGLSGANFAWPTRATVGLGLLAFLVLMAEGSVVDWSAILMRESFRLDASSAAMAYGFFSAGMTAARLAGDWLRLKLGAVHLVRWSALIACGSITLAVAVDWADLSILAFGFAGLGLGNIAPILFAGGGRLEPSAPGRGIAAVTTLGYAGFLAGPPLIGFLAEATGLPASFGLIAAAILVIAVFAPAVRTSDTY